jgi:hypothetical protein
MQVLTAASMKTATFWSFKPCCLVEVDRLFRGVSVYFNGAVSQKAVIFTTNSHGIN